MNEEQLLERIRSKGYWRVLIRPTSFEKLRIPTLGEVRQLVQSCIVYWRGWDYPHWNSDSVRNMADWVESSEDWDAHLEYWRFYRSGQFIHLFALHEDHMDVDKVLPIRYPPRPKRAGYVSTISTIFTLTEILEFAARLSNKGVLRPSALISVGLYNMKDHQLATFNSSRFMPDSYVYNESEPIVIEREVPQQQLVATPDEFALDFVVEIFERFNWNRPPRQAFKEDQKRLRERRL